MSRAGGPFHGLGGVPCPVVGVPGLAPGGVLVFAICTLGTTESDSADGYPIDEVLTLRPDEGAGEGFVATRLAATS